MFIYLYNNFGLLEFISNKFTFPISLCILLVYISY